MSITILYLYMYVYNNVCQLPYYISTCIYIIYFWNVFELLLLHIFTMYKIFFNKKKLFISTTVLFCFSHNQCVSHNK